MADRDELGEFLRTRRAQVTPQSVGLPGGFRRRVPGLRREELAQLAGISVEYYQRLEQGRATQPSDEVLDAIARALRLSDIELAHLDSLAHPPRRVAARSTDDAAVAPRPELRRMLHLMDRVPALVINDCFDVLAANPLATRLLVDVTATRSGTPNLARYLFLDPGARDFYAEWDAVAAETAGQLRLSAGRYPRDGALAALVAELMTCADFRALWDAGGVAQRSSGAKSFHHPALGMLTLHYQNFMPADNSRQRLITFVAEEQSATEAALQLLATWATAAMDPPGPNGGPAESAVQPAQNQNH